jgi:GT2 family glycosyltransferase
MARESESAGRMRETPAHLDNSHTRESVGVVAIGRNEGERLRRCLESVRREAAAVVYVDSGSADDSVTMARSLGVEVVQIDPSTPFTAARSRNAGVQRLLEIKPDVEFLQVVDGDCEVVASWIDRALDEMRKEGNDNVAIVCGRRRERHPDASIYNRLVDMEWNTEVGEAASCGGDALMRVAAFKAVGGYDATVIAGEEPEMCWRMRQAGWRVVRIDAEMTLHDAQMTRFGQWWKRNVRAGHAYAEGHAMHGHVDGFCARQIQSIVLWTLVAPLIALGLAWLTWGASLLIFALYIVLWMRIRTYRIDTHRDSPEDASLYANFCIAGKFANMQGVAKYWWNRLRGRRTALIEYKGASVIPATDGGKP